MKTQKEIIKELQDTITSKEVIERLSIEAYVKTMKEFIRIIIDMSLKNNLTKQEYVDFNDKKTRIDEIEKKGLWN